MVPDWVISALTKTRGLTHCEWISLLPNTLAACVRRWNLTIERPLSTLSYNYVAYVSCSNGTQAVLKISPADDVEFQTEVEALKIFNGRGAVRLKELDLELGSMLLERLEPGTPLQELSDDEKATLIAAQVMERLWRPVPADSTFPTTKDWSDGLHRLRQRFSGGTGPLPASLVERAELLFAELHSSESQPVLLHGDLHYGNILGAKREPWLAIDPKGVVGEPAYEIGALLRNPLPGLIKMPNASNILIRRVDQLSEYFGFERYCLRAWGLAQVVLSAWWLIENGEEGWEPMIECANLLEVLPSH